jgi:GTP cyclohydrolase I
MNEEPMTNSLDDVAEGRPQRSLEWPIKKVGMENIACQVHQDSSFTGARASAFVSLTSREKRGIHMSRLFELVTHLHEKPLSRSWTTEILNKMLESHADISDHAFLEVSFDLMLLRKALISDNTGWRAYPVRVLAEKSYQRSSYTLEVRVLYSSTCPCSASLSRHAIQDQFTKDFEGRDIKFKDVHNWLAKEKSIAAVPHAQRSEALGRFVINENVSEPDFANLINAMENALATPVQTAVKREDEQEFARRNAQNLMFCEDAARRLKAEFQSDSRFSDFFFEVKHFESLHPHDVVAQISKF